MKTEYVWIVLLVFAVFMALAYLVAEKVWQQMRRSYVCYRARPPYPKPSYRSRRQFRRR